MVFEFTKIETLNLFISYRLKKKKKTVQTFPNLKCMVISKTRKYLFNSFKFAKSGVARKFEDKLERNQKLRLWVANSINLGVSLQITLLIVLIPALFHFSSQLTTLREQKPVQKWVST